MKIILDFDRVLFDWDSYIHDVKEKGYEGLEVHPDIWNYLKPDDYYYSDVIPFLESKQRNLVSVISAMTPSYGPHAREYQKRKIKLSSIHTYVNDVIVIEGDKGIHVRNIVHDERAVFVDDKLEHLTSARTMCPALVCLQLIRKGGSLESSVSQTDDIHVVNDLFAVDAIIKGL